MASKDTSSSNDRARGLLTCVLAALVVLCSSGSARADEASSKLAVRAVVTANCSVNAASVRVAADGSFDPESANAAVALSCAAGVQPRTSVAYESAAPSNGSSAVSSGTESDAAKNLVVTVMF